MDPSTIFKIITNSTLLATRLLSGHPPEKIEFKRSHYCSLVFEDALVSTSVVRVSASHTEGKPFLYNIIEGNEDGLFSVNGITGEITVAAPLDSELKTKYTLRINAESLDGDSAEATVEISVADVNDNSPVFEVQDLQVDVIEEDHLGLPHVIGKVWAKDLDWVDQNELLYTLVGDGVDGYSSDDAFFSIHPRNGQITQLRPLDRDPPNGKPVWNLKVKVHDGQSDWVTSRLNGFERKSEGKPDGKKSYPEDAVQRPLYRTYEKRSMISSLRRRKPLFDYSSSIRYKRHLDKDIFDSIFFINKIKKKRKYEIEREKEIKHSSKKIKNSSILFSLQGNKNSEISEKPTINDYKIRVKRDVIKGNDSDNNRKVPRHSFQSDKEIIYKYLRHKGKRNSISRKNRNRNFFNMLKENSLLHKPIKMSKMLNEKELFPHLKNFTFSQKCDNENEESSSIIDKCVKLNSTTQENKFINVNSTNLNHTPLLFELKNNTDNSIDQNTSNHSTGIKKIYIYDKHSRCASCINREEKKESSNRSSRKLKLNHNIIRERKYFPSIFLKRFNLQEGRLSHRSNGKREFIDIKKDNILSPTGNYYKRDYPIYLSREIRHLSPISFDNIDTCKLFTTFPSTMTQEQKAKLKYVVTKLAKDQRPNQTDKVHVVETSVTIIVKDINDNPPIFPNTTIYAEVQENGPVDLHVAMVTAWDADDSGSSPGSQLRYYLEKNAVDERNGSPIFKIIPTTGEIRTALCCLDRESTLEYQLQVVATDGGGLKGTGTVAVRLSDVNDNSPRFARREWQVVIDETFGTAEPNNETLFEITVNDLDTSNKFLFRVVKSSGWGWEFFGIRASESIGQVYALKPLDYEDKRHRSGFRFLVEVTDRGSWEDLRSVESAWVVVKLRDVSDNPPIFQKRLIHITISEDVPPQTLITKIIATDPDQDGKGVVDLELLDEWGDLEIKPDGEIRTTNFLDRESPAGERGMIRILASDREIPSLSSTATLVISLKDVNDCAPRMIGPRIFHLKENSEPRRIGILLATDDDNWGLGHGPPFAFSLNENNPVFIFDNFSLKFLKELDSGRGGAELWTRAPLDREKHPQIIIKVNVSDASFLMSSNDVMVVVDDVNDNDMKSGQKIIYVWKTKEAATDFSIGRVFVNDPDDNDYNDKIFSWAQRPNSLFSLRESDGEIKVSSHISEGNYHLQFSVSDTFRGQKNVSANVTVLVRSIDESALLHAIPVTLSPLTPQELTKGWTPNSFRGRLGKLLSTLNNILGKNTYVVEVVSVSAKTLLSFDVSAPLSVQVRGGEGEKRSRPIAEPSNHDSQYLNPSATVWISAKDSRNTFVKAPKLRGLLELSLSRIEKIMNLKVEFEELQVKKLYSDFVTSNHSNYPLTLFSSSPHSSSSSSSSSQPSSSSKSSFSSEENSSSNVSHPLMSSVEVKPIKAAPFQLVDANETSLVMPVIERFFSCPQPSPPSWINSGLDHSQHHRTFYINKQREIRREYRECKQTSCLNGGRCVPTRFGSRCICPGNTRGRFCKLLTISFSRGGFAWLDPLPPCFPLTFSLEFRTNSNEGIILYSGPFTINSYPYQRANSLTVLQLLQGNLQLLLEGSVGSMKLEVSTYEKGKNSNNSKSEELNGENKLRSNSFADGKWHNVQVVLDVDGAFIMIDYCSHEWSLEDRPKRSCFEHKHWRRKTQAKRYPWKGPWQISLPLQVGGIAHDPPNGRGYRTRKISGKSFEGCIQNLRINDDLVDLGSSSLERNVQKSCVLQSANCPECANPSICIPGEVSDIPCVCEAGYTGENCSNQTTPMSLLTGDVKILFPKAERKPRTSIFQLLFKTHKRNVSILQIKSRNSTSLRLSVQYGFLCFEYKRKQQHPNQFDLEDLKKNFSFPTTFHKEIPNHDIQLKIKEINTQIKKTIMPKPSTSKDKQPDITVCLNNVIYSDSHWHKVRGWVYGHHLILEVDDGDKFERNQTSYFDQKKISGLSPSFVEFIMDKNEGIIIGNESTEENNMYFSSSQVEPLFCIDDLRIFGSPIHLMERESVSQMSEEGNGEESKVIGCKVSDRCQQEEECSEFENCESNKQNKCGCPPGETPTTYGCQRYDPCVYLPCLHGGTCYPTTGGNSNCSCLPSFKGNFCQFKSRKGVESDLAIPIVAIGISLCVLILALTGCLICQYINKARRRRELNPENSSESNLSEASNKAVRFDNQINAKMKNDPKIDVEVIDIRENTNSSEMEMTILRLSSLAHKIEESLGKSNDEANTQQDDLRAYAYEGEGSFSGSLGSAKSGLKEEYKEGLEILPLNSILKDVVDLLKDLPDGCPSTLKRKSASSSSILANKDFATQSNKHFASQNNPRYYRSSLRQLRTKDFETVSKSMDIFDHKKNDITL